MTPDELRAEISRRRQNTKTLIANLDAEIANMKSILDPSFVYVHSSKTDLKKKFTKIRAMQKAQALRDAEIAAKVRPIKREAK